MCDCRVVSAWWPILRSMTQPLTREELAEELAHALPDREWRNAVWDYVTKESDARERATERRHKELVAALDKVHRAMSDVAVSLPRRAA